MLVSLRTEWNYIKRIYLDGSISQREIHREHTLTQSQTQSKLFRFDEKWGRANRIFMALLKYICVFLSFHQKCLFDLVLFEQLHRLKHPVTHTHTPKLLYKVVYPYKFFQAQLNFDISPGI